MQEKKISPIFLNLLRGKVSGKGIWLMNNAIAYTSIVYLLVTTYESVSAARMTNS